MQYFSLITAPERKVNLIKAIINSNHEITEKKQPNYGIPMHDDLRIRHKFHQPEMALIQ